MNSSAAAVEKRSAVAGLVDWCARNPYKTFALFFAFYIAFVLVTARPRQALDSHLVTGDGFYYYAYAHSLFFDRDVNFKNEYEEFGPVTMGKTRFPTGGPERRLGDPLFGVLPRETQPSKAPTPYGPWDGEFPEYPGNMWEMGSGILWLPFVAAAHLAMLALRGAGLTTLPADGYSILYQCAIAVASSFYAFLASCIVYRTLRLRCGAAESAWAVMFLITATALVCYVVYQVAYSHSQEFFATALVFYLIASRRSFARMSYGDAALLGAAIGLTALIRWQMVLWGFVPLALWVWELAVRKKRGRTFLKGLLLGAAACAAFLPQALAWKSIYGQYITMPMDNDFGRHFLMLRVKEMFLVLVSNNHGMFFWHPITLVGFVGVFAALFARRSDTGWRPVLALSLVVFALSAFVNGMVPDWWGGSAFGMRRMVGMYPLIALGLAALLSATRLATARPGWLVGVWMTASAWNAALLFIWIFHLGGRVLPH